MSHWIAFFRGINVGGHNILPMKELKASLEKSGCEAITTYIQSGNVVFRHAESDAKKMATHIRALVLADFGFQPNVLLLTGEQLKDAHTNNPFSAGESEPKTLHLYFLTGPTGTVDEEKLASLKSDSEQFDLIGRVFYLYAPNGIGRSKLAAKVEKCLGVAATARNWRTVTKVLQLALDAD